MPRIGKRIWNGVHFLNIHWLWHSTCTHTNRKLFIESFIAHVTVSFALRAKHIAQNCKHRLNTTLCVLANEVRTRLFVLYVQCLTFKYTISVVCTMLFAHISHSVSVHASLTLSLLLSLAACLCVRLVVSMREYFFLMWSSEHMIDSNKKCQSFYRRSAINIVVWKT